MSRERVVVNGMKCVDLAHSAEISFAGRKLNGDVVVTARSRVDIDEFVKRNFSILDRTSGFQNIQGMEQP